MPKVSFTNTGKLGVDAIAEVAHFAYLGSVVDIQDRNGADVKARIGNARWPFVFS